ncbi:glycosyltransferase family 2 protein [Cellulomonas sp. Sa3CUA2]|uniref:Glycosyltransferase family 2 protein n=1 Tax=Cellulomonas avistercoris TaxID=2762242 RepID=A0ABR8QIF3_9CELL|nr:glycosyltransferase family 2 protein [Cellulomonas avistercoris]MBD7920205.1 glycosyltransferase family 2 protein [Cellulomonas avistercoris]
MTQPDVTVVTVTYNASALVLDCLASLRAQRLGDVTMDVVVVDNASSDGTADLVEARAPWVRVLRARENLGFAGGNDLALRDVTSRYVLLVNNDATLEADTVRTLVEAMDRAAPDVAAMSPTVLLAEHFRAAAPTDTRGVVTGPDGRWTPDPDGDVRLVNSTGNEVRTDGYGVDRGWLAQAAQHRPPRDVFGFTGAAALLRTAALRQVGLFDETFFMYYEDTDLSWRLRLAGWRVEHCPGAVVEHVHSASSVEGSAFFRFHDTRNRLATLTKCAPAGLVVRAVARDVVTTVSILVRRTRPAEHARTRLRALSSYAMMLPALLAERRRIGRTAAVRRRDVAAHLVPVAAAYGPYRDAG